MKLCFENLESKIELTDSSVAVIVFNSKQYYSKIIRMLYSECNTSDYDDLPVYLVDSKEKRIKIKSKVELILDPVLIDYSERKFVSALSNLLKEGINHDIERWTIIEKSITDIQKSVLDMIDDCNLPVEYNAEWDAARVIKSLGISIKPNSMSLSCFEMLSSFLDTVSNLKTTDYYCFAGLNRYLTDDELIQFYKEALQNQVKVICIMQSDHAPQKNEYSSCLYVDEDYDEFFIPQTLSNSLNPLV